MRPHTTGDGANSRPSPYGQAGGSPHTPPGSQWPLPQSRLEPQSAPSAPTVVQVPAPPQVRSTAHSEGSVHGAPSAPAVTQTNAPPEKSQKAPAPHSGEPVQSSPSGVTSWQTRPDGLISSQKRP